jgi:hypothetical protein
MGKSEFARELSYECGYNCIVWLNSEFDNLMPEIRNYTEFYFS